MESLSFVSRAGLFFVIISYAIEASLKILRFDKFKFFLKKSLIMSY